MKGKSKSTQNEREMQKLVERYRNSEVTQRDFAREHGVGLSKFKYWCQRYKDSDDQSVFVPLEVELTPKNLRHGLWIHLPGDIRIETDAPLAEVLGILVKGN